MSWCCDRRACISRVGHTDIALALRLSMGRTNTQITCLHPMEDQYPSPFLVSALWVPSVSPIAFLLFMFSYRTYRVRGEWFNEEHTQHTHTTGRHTRRILYYVFPFRLRSTAVIDQFIKIVGRWFYQLPYFIIRNRRVCFCQIFVSAPSVFCFSVSSLPAISVQRQHDLPWCYHASVCIVYLVLFFY